MTQLQSGLDLGTGSWDVVLNRTLYQPGDQVRGQIRFNKTDPGKINFLFVFKGVEEVEWKNEKNPTKPHKSVHEYFNVGGVPIGNMNRYDDVTGHHCIPFEIPLPNILPGSVKVASDKSDDPDWHGKTVYTIGAQFRVREDGDWQTGDFLVPVNVINHLPPEEMTRETAERSIDGCCMTYGKTKMSVSCDDKSYLAGMDVVAIVRYDNEGGPKITKTTATLSRVVEMISEYNVKKIVKKPVSTKTFAGCAEGKKGQVTVAMPTNVSFQASSMGGHLKVYYELQVSGIFEDGAKMEAKPIMAVIIQEAQQEDLPEPELPGFEPRKERPFKLKAIPSLDPGDAPMWQRKTGGLHTIKHASRGDDGSSFHIDASTSPLDANEETMELLSPVHKKVAIPPAGMMAGGAPPRAPSSPGSKISNMSAGKTGNISTNSKVSKHSQASKNSKMNKASQGSKISQIGEASQTSGPKSSQMKSQMDDSV